MRDVGLAEGRPFDKALVDRAEQELKRQYINRSMYAAQVVTTVTPCERNRVNLNFSVVEGDVAKIKDIRIVGNQAFSESTLRDLFDLDTGGLMSWYTKSDRYSRAKLNADLESAALALPDARLPGVQGRLHPGGHFARQARHVDDHQHHRRQSLRGVVGGLAG